MGMAEAITLRNDRLEAKVARFGAELVGLRHALHGELLWSGDRNWWARQSPILFPVTGRCMDDRIKVGDESFPMPLHGFAHSSTFEAVEVGGEACRLRLQDGPATRAHYPFPFVLDLSYRLAKEALRVEATITNPGDGMLPASFGFHPGFRWPLEPGMPKRSHFIRFDDDEVLDVSRAKDGFMLPETRQMTLDDRRLWLDEAFFDPGALVFLTLKSRRIVFGGAGSGSSIRMTSENLPALLLWMKPGADFLCLEPWAGQPDPVSFGRQFAVKPGLSLIAPGAAKRFAMTLSIEG